MKWKKKRNTDRPESLGLWSAPFCQTEADEIHQPSARSTMKKWDRALVFSGLSALITCRHFCTVIDPSPAYIHTHTCSRTNKSNHVYNATRMKVKEAKKCRDGTSQNFFTSYSTYFLAIKSTCVMTSFVYSARQSTCSLARAETVASFV